MAALDGFLDHVKNLIDSQGVTVVLMLGGRACAWCRGCPQAERREEPVAGRVVVEVTVPLSGEAELSQGLADRDLVVACVGDRIYVDAAPF